MRDVYLFRALESSVPPSPVPPEIKKKERRQSVSVDDNLLTLWRQRAKEAEIIKSYWFDDNDTDGFDIFKFFNSYVQPIVNDIIFDDIVQKPLFSDFEPFQNIIIEMFINSLQEVAPTSKGAVKIVLKGGNLQKFYLNQLDSNKKGFIKDDLLRPSDIDVDFHCDDIKDIHLWVQTVHLACKKLRDKEEFKCKFETKYKKIYENKIVTDTDTQKTIKLISIENISSKDCSIDRINNKTAVSCDHGNNNHLVVKQNLSIRNDKGETPFFLVRIQKPFLIQYKENYITKRKRMGGEILDIGMSVLEHDVHDIEQHNNPKYYRYTLLYVITELSNILFEEQNAPKFEKRLKRFLALCMLYLDKQQPNLAREVFDYWLKRNERDASQPLQFIDTKIKNWTPSDSKKTALFEKLILTCYQYYPPNCKNLCKLLFTK